MASSSTSHAVQDVVSQIESLTGSDTVSVQDIVRAFGATAFLPIMLVPALLVVSPLSGIPLFSSFCGITIAIISAQLLIGRERIWLPQMVLRREVSGARLRNGTTRIKGFAARVDDLSRDRLRALVGRGRAWIVFTACLICGVSMPFLEMMPFSSSIMGLAVILHIVGVLARDGLFVLAGFCVMGIAAMIPAVLVMGILSV